MSLTTFTSNGSMCAADPRSAPAESTDNVATPKSGGYIYSLLERVNGCALPCESV